MSKNAGTLRYIHAIELWKPVSSTTFEVLTFHFLGVRHMKVDLVAALVWKHMGDIPFVVLLH